MSSEIVVGLILVALVAVLVYSGMRGVPGIGILVALVTVAVFVIWVNDEGLASIGFFSPDDWVSTVTLGIVAGILLQLLGVVIIEPISERVTGEAHDHSVLDGIKSSWSKLLLWIAVGWVMGGFVEEAVFRGLLIGETVGILGNGTLTVVAVVLASSVVFGLSHWYQGRAGALSTGVTSVFLGWLFVAQDFNIWASVIAHGTIDTVGLALIGLGGVEPLQRLTSRLFAKSSEESSA